MFARPAVRRSPGGRRGTARIAEHEAPPPGGRRGAKVLREPPVDYGFAHNQRLTSAQTSVPSTGRSGMAEEGPFGSTTGLESSMIS